MFGLRIYRKKDIDLYKEQSEIDDVIIRQLQQEVLHLKENQKLIDYIQEIKKFKDESIIDVGNNKGDSYVLTKRVTRTGLNIIMKDPYTRTFPEVYATLEKEYSCNKSGGICSPNKVVFIRDIHAVNKRRGNGKILIDAVISYAKEHQYEKIKGELTDRDKKDTPGLPIFYEKMGFTLNKDNTGFEMKLYY